LRCQASNMPGSSTPQLISGGANETPTNQEPILPGVNEQ
jgi:hypothetical protein